MWTLGIWIVALAGEYQSSYFPFYSKIIHSFYEFHRRKFRFSKNNAYISTFLFSWRSTGDGACSPYTTWQRVYKHRPWDRMHLDPIKMKQVYKTLFGFCLPIPHHRFK